MTNGTVQWFDVPKGYGFIKPDDGGVDVLVDICAVERAGMLCLDQGQRLSFEPVHNERMGIWCAGNLNESICPQSHHFTRSDADGPARSIRPKVPQRDRGPFQI